MGFLAGLAVVLLEVGLMIVEVTRGVILHLAVVLPVIVPDHVLDLVKEAEAVRIALIKILDLDRAVDLQLKKMEILPKKIKNL